MKLIELMEIIEIDSPEGFIYFEQFAALIETDALVPFETIYELLEGVDPQTLSELTKNYFQEILDKIPDEEVEFHSLMSVIGQNLSALAVLISDSVESKTGLRNYAEELYRFRDWYLTESEVLCEDRQSGEERRVTVFEALVLFRMEGLGEGSYFYDFSGSLDYPLNEYLFPLSGFDENEYDNIEYDENEYDNIKYDDNE
jgi:hypothetical protein